MEKSDNALIAEFMGLDVHEGNVTDGIAELPISKLKYNTSWDWLMPVVEKIGDLYLECPGPVSDVNRLPIGSHIQEVYQEVVNFIKWYGAKE